MDDLVTLAVQAHGGAELWGRISRFRAAVSITGSIWALKGRPDLLGDVLLEGYTRDQFLTITPFPQAGCRATWRPGRQTVESAAGDIVAERRDPEASFAATTRQSPWDTFQVAYFACESTWNYLVAPFLFTRGDFRTEETWPWREGGEIWRPLLVTYPRTIVAHTRRQTYFFDQAGLLRRLDYTVDHLGGGAAVHYPSRYREFDGIMVPTRRRVYVRQPDGWADLSSVTVAIDVDDVTFS